MQVRATIVTSPSLPKTTGRGSGRFEAVAASAGTVACLLLGKLFLFFNGPYQPPQRGAVRGESSQRYSFRLYRFCAPSPSTKIPGSKLTCRNWNQNCGLRW